MAYRQRVLAVKYAIFIAWVTIACVVGGWNIAKERGHDPYKWVQCLIYKCSSPEPFVKKQYPNTFENLVKRTE